MNVTHIYRTYYPDPPGGLQEAIRQIALATSQLNINNKIFTLSPNPYPKLIQLPGIEVNREKSWISPASCDIGGVAAFCRFSKIKLQSDIIHYHFPWPFADLLELTNNSPKRRVMTYHSDIVRQRFLGTIYAPLMWKMLDRMDIIVATSDAYKESSSILSHPKISSKVRVIPLGLDETTYVANTDIDFKFLDSEPFFLFLGVLRYYKGVHFLIQAATELNCKIVIAGTGPEESNLKNLAKKLNLNNILFLGQVSDTEKIALIKKSLAFILPSHLRSEAFGVVLIEACMFGKPMITCEIGTGTSFVNKNNETGFVVKPESSKDLADAMKILLANDSLAKKMGLNARKRYESLFSGAVQGQAYLSIYEELL